jgi:cytochrome c biogenesis protein CcmG/thiol:disulfide interchange protein DsbE
VRRWAQRAAIALAVTLALGCGGRAPAPVAPGPVLDAAWPALDGGEVRLAELRGQIVVLHVFTTWSAAADLENDALTAADARPDVTVIGLARDPDGYTVVAPWRRGADVHFLIALADDATRAGAGPLGRIAQIPTTLVLDRSGRIVARAERQLAPPELDAAIARAR